MKLNTHQIDLFGKRATRFSLPTNYKPIRPDYFTISQIYLTRGSLATPERRQFVEIPVLIIGISRLMVFALMGASIAACLEHEV